MRSRIDRLETLVRSLISQEDSSKEFDGFRLKEFMSNDSGPVNGSQITKSQRALSPGSVASDETERSGETSFPAGGQKMSIDTRSTHWDAILHDVRIYGMPSELSRQKTNI
jgi:hypothetical protein